MYVYIVKKKKKVLFVCLFVSHYLAIEMWFASLVIIIVIFLIIFCSFIIDYAKSDTHTCPPATARCAGVCPCLFLALAKTPALASALT
jgi:hypothetical protein